jgi:hypothetical protein
MNGGSAQILAKLYTVESAHQKTTFRVLSIGTYILAVERIAWSMIAV